MMSWTRMLRHRIAQMGWAADARTYNLGDGRFKLTLYWPRYGRSWPGRYRWQDAVSVSVIVPKGHDRGAEMYPLFLKASAEAKVLLFDVVRGDFIECERDDVFGTPIIEGENVASKADFSR